MIKHLQLFLPSLSKDVGQITLELPPYAVVGDPFTIKGKFSVAGLPGQGSVIIYIGNTKQRKFVAGPSGDFELGQTLNEVGNYVVAAEAHPIPYLEYGPALARSEEYQLEVRPPFELLGVRWEPLKKALYLGQLCNALFDVRNNSSSTRQLVVTAELGKANGNFDADFKSPSSRPSLSPKETSFGKGIPFNIPPDYGEGVRDGMLRVVDSDTGYEVTYVMKELWEILPPLPSGRWSCTLTLVRTADWADANSWWIRYLALDGYGEKSIYIHAPSDGRQTIVLMGGGYSDVDLDTTQLLVGVSKPYKWEEILLSQPWIPVEGATYEVDYPAKKISRVRQDG